MKAALGIQTPVGNAPYCQALHLLPFDSKQIEEASRGVSASVRKEICQLALKDSKFMEIVSRPSLLYIVGLLWKKEKLSQYKEKLNSAFLMDLFIRNSYRRQGAKVKDTPNFMALNSREREFFMSGIATYMASESLPNQITKEQFQDIVLKLIEVIPESVSSSTAISGEVSRPLRERIKDDEHALEHIKTDVRACGILVTDPTKSGAFKFAHKSFMEYLFADIVCYRTLKHPTDEYWLEFAGAIVKATNIFITSSVLRYPESISFFAELIINRSSKFGMQTGDNKEKIVKYLYNLIVFGGKSRAPKIFLLNRLLQYLRIRGDKPILSIFSPLIFYAISASAIFAVTQVIFKSPKLTMINIFYLAYLSFIPAMFWMFFRIIVPRKYLRPFKIFLLCSRSLGINNELILKTFGKDKLKYSLAIDAFLLEEMKIMGTKD